MTAIVSSAVTLDNLQADGRRIVIEQFTDDQGNIYQQSYMADPSMDIQARLTADANTLLAQLQAQQDGN
jgi:hypothetical protein